MRIDPMINNCLISTITQSKSDENYDVISKEYFITKDQEIEHKFTTRIQREMGYFKT